MKRITLGYLAGYQCYCCLLERPFNDACWVLAPRADGMVMLIPTGSISLFVRIREDICSVSWIAARRDNSV